MNWLSEILSLTWILSLMSPSEWITVLGIEDLRNNKTDSQPKATSVQYLLSSLFFHRGIHAAWEKKSLITIWTGQMSRQMGAAMSELGHFRTHCPELLVQREGGWDERNNWPPIFSWIFDNDAFLLGQWLAQRFCVYWLGHCWQVHGQYSGQELEDTTNNAPE